MLMHAVQNGSWTPNRDGTYTPRSRYLWLLCFIPTFPYVAAVRNKYIVPTHAFILWLVHHGKLLTMDRLKSWNMVVVDEKCFLCGVEDESIDHLFFRCSFSRGMCKELGRWLQVSSMLVRLTDWKHISGQSALKAGIIVAGVAAAVSLIWNELNAWLHCKQR